MITRTVGRATILVGDCVESMRSLADDSIDCCVTSPPYWALRDYGNDDQIGQEKTPEEYVAKMVEVFREVRRVLKRTGVCFLNLGDTYAKDRSSGLKPKNLVGIPWRVALALQDDGWILRQDIIWEKLGAMPESVRDRCSRSHEYVFLLAKSKRYYFDNEAIKEDAVCGSRTLETVRPSKPKGSFNGKTEAMADTGQNSFRAVTDDRNKRSVWSIPVASYRKAHFATYPPKLVEPCVLAGTSDAGCCGKCGVPYVRKVVRTRVATRPGTDTKVDDVGGDRKITGNRDPQRHVTNTRTVGWSSACKCGVGAVPCTVLDPFGGSGTTGQVAIGLGRRAILCELNPEYVDLMVERLESTHPTLF